jgi:16S rRNA (uracil1498-N3)-methyltransferase
MPLHRLYTQQPLEPGQTLALEPGPARHAAQVLRLTTGDRLLLFNGDGRDYDATVEAAGRDGVRVRVGVPGENEPAPGLEIRLGLGISRGERMDFALQKAVELGVTAIAPLFTQRTVVRLAGERLHKRAAHWGSVVIAACEQSGRRRLPALAPPCALADWLAQGQPNGMLLHHAAPRALSALPPPAVALTLLIGPEGGLSEREREDARDHGFTAVRLGPRILRTETAPLAAIAAIQTLWGDFAERSAGACPASS